MKILIVENEVYLAQSIAAKLTSIGHECEISVKLKDVMAYEKLDALLLSANMFGENIYDVIKKFQDSIIIMLISYISNDTVSRPLKSGASDYIQKPFMVEELLRKLEHFREFNSLKKLRNSFENYMDFYFLDSKNFEFKNLKLPLFLNSKNSKISDEFAYKYSKFIKSDFNVISLDDKNLDSLKRLNSYSYLLNFSSLKNKEQFFEIIKNRPFIINAKGVDISLPFETLNLESDKNFSMIDDILTVDEYFKFVIKNYQDSFSDTQLAKKLGISRKSLWEKRKRYGIQKHNNIV
ncbi:response regulator [Campylobacter corcagiensis]|uniref:Response regulator n=1 Tax=Campylobacter corcagiensis TaxID=1448857 RepID=A0A7M1LFL6_9BACT|nr:response regulator [Campylobacter corcagiensis]QKF65161.1 response regulator receiver domain-containing protein [Campylobacter corcagiensis]QOQ86696.1 response regulator [Campylobacter corcagiensis]